jgi:hypothetical protein
MWLRPNHPFRFNAHDFDGKIERRFAPTIMSRYEMLQDAILYERWMLNGQKEDDNPSHKIGVKCNLPY